MSFDIAFDYRFDSTGFFDDPAARAALEAAAARWEALIGDAFDPVPAGTTFTVDDPSASGTDRTVTLDRAIDDLLIFVGAEPLPGPLAIAGADGFDADGDVLRARISDDFRGQGPVTDYEPWAGTISFEIDPGAPWSFDVDAPVAGRSDFLSVAMHEIAHVLGFGQAGAFDAFVAVEGGALVFTGPNARAANGGAPVPLEADESHVEDGFAGDDVLLDPTLTTGTRKLPTPIDRAILADIGYEIAGFAAQGTTPPIATEGDDRTIFGTGLADRIDARGGDDRVQGAGGDDTLEGGAGDDTLFGQEGADALSGGAGADLLLGGDGNDLLSGGAGDDELQGGDGDDRIEGGTGADRAFGGAGIDTFVVAAGDGSLRIVDLDLARETVVLRGSGFADARAALAAVEKPFTNVSRITFSDGTRVEVTHEAQDGTPLTAANLTVADAPAPDPVPGPGPGPAPGPAPLVVEGGPGRDRLQGGLGDEAILGRGGRDILIGGGGDDTMTGGAGVDAFVLSPDPQGGVVTIADWRDGGGGRDLLALDDQLLGLGTQAVDVRAIPLGDALAALRAGRALYDGASGALSIDADGAAGPADPVRVAVIEGGGPIALSDVLLF